MNHKRSYGLTTTARQNRGHAYEQREAAENAYREALETVNELYDEWQEAHLLAKRATLAFESAQLAELETTCALRRVEKAETELRTIQRERQYSEERLANGKLPRAQRVLAACEAARVSAETLKDLELDSFQAVRCADELKAREVVARRNLLQCKYKADATIQQFFIADEDLNSVIRNLAAARATQTPR